MDFLYRAGETAANTDRHPPPLALVMPTERLTLSCTVVGVGTCYDERSKVQGDAVMYGVGGGGVGGCSNNQSMLVE
jgi:hypothetical protein